MRSNRTLKYFSRFIKSVPQLNQKEKDVLIGRLRENTLEGIGGSFGRSEARIRQIEKRALAKIKNKKYQLSLFR
jgi:DNA-directed RNA polymerase sigma subunit (sigma70/sigma32)